MHTSILIASGGLAVTVVFIFANYVRAKLSTEPRTDASSPPRRPLPRWKRTLDLLCIAFSLPALLPLAGLIALAIKMCSRGPVLFSQERIGLLGQPFRCFKFRTMKPNAETRTHEAHLATLMASGAPLTKLDASLDSRVISIGWLLRSTGLDELPQLINVVRGEMTLVGPRPCVRYEFEKFSPQDRQRFNAVPGLTGLWQVSGKNRTTFQRMIELDIAYGRNMSLPGDVGILFRTLFVVLEQTTEAARQKMTVRTERAALHGSTIELRPSV